MELSVSRILKFDDYEHGVRNCRRTAQNGFAVTPIANRSTRRMSGCIVTGTTFGASRMFGENCSHEVVLFEFLFAAPSVGNEWATFDSAVVETGGAFGQIDRVPLTPVVAEQHGFVVAIWLYWWRGDSIIWQNDLVRYLTHRAVGAVALGPPAIASLSA